MLSSLLNTSNQPKLIVSHQTSALGQIALYSAALVSFITLNACDYLPTAENKVKKAVVQRLIDPDSARFEFLQAGKEVGNYCGYVNSKNRMGGYAGASPFIYLARTNEVLIAREIPNRQTFQSYYFKLRADATEPGDLGEIISACQFPDDWARTCVSSFPVRADPLCERATDSSSAFVKKLFEEFGR